MTYLKNIFSSPLYRIMTGVMMMIAMVYILLAMTSAVDITIAALDKLVTDVNHWLSSYFYYDV